MKVTANIDGSKTLLGMRDMRNGYVYKCEKTESVYTEGDLVMLVGSPSTNYVMILNKIDITTSMHVDTKSRIFTCIGTLEQLNLKVAKHD